MSFFDTGKFIGNKYMYLLYSKEEKIEDVIIIVCSGTWIVSISISTYTRSTKNDLMQKSKLESGSLEQSQNAIKKGR
jgi:hypothetical protein